jgi:hypothetical protein
MVTAHPTFRLHGATGWSSQPYFGPDEPDTEFMFSLRWSVSDAEPMRVYLAHLKEAQQKIASFAELPRNWDGQGAAAIGFETADLAMKTLWDLASMAAMADHELPSPAVGPSPDGGIGFEWSTPDVYVAVECIDNSRSVYIRAEGRETERTVRSSKELWTLVRGALIQISESLVAA